MNNNTLFDFAVDKTAKTVSVNMEFDAELELVWDAFTKQEILDQWYAPAPWTSRTKHMNFEVGGKRFYAMVGPDGSESWGLQTYTSITPKTNFKMFNVFADKDENPQLPGSDWDLNFAGQGETTTVNISIYNESRERMEMVLAGGFREGFTATLTNLRNLLATMSAK